MARRNIVDRLRAGELLILDGGTGTELQRRGVDVEKGTRGDEIGPWSAAANFDAPDVVREIHEDYLRAGADIIISNNFYTTPAMLERIGKRDEWEAYTRRGGELAIQARDAVNPDAYVAGGIAPPYAVRPARGVRGPGSGAGRTWRRFHDRRVHGGGLHHRRPHLRLRDGGGCLRGLGLAGFPGSQQGEGAGRVVRRGSFAELVAALKGHPVEGIFLMCSYPKDITGSLPVLREVYDGPIGTYAHLEYNENPKFGSSPDEPFFTLAVGENTPEKYAEIARGWKQGGAQIIGGCCATNPDHIRALRRAL